MTLIRSKPMLFTSVFIAGMSTLAIEFTMSRLLQAVYGTSNIVWANVIGLVLLFLTLGYFIGGRWADRSPNEETYYRLLTLAGLSTIGFLLLTSFALRWAATGIAALNIGSILGSLLAVIVTLAVPMTLLGCISPFAIRLAVDDIASAGRISGQIYAISTLGSLLGTYLPTLLIIPLAGSRMTALIFGSLLTLAGLLGLRKPAISAGAIGLVLVLFGATWATPFKRSEGHLYGTESPYNFVEVVRRDDCNYLLLNEGQAIHSYYCDGHEVRSVSVWEMMLVAPYFYEETPAVDRAAVIGLATGTIPHRFFRVFPGVDIDGIEIDPAIVDVGYDYFDMAHPDLNVIVGDGRFEFNQLEGEYDIITIDAYRVPYIPWHLTTVEFFEEIDRKLSNDGALAINVGYVPGDRRLVEAITNTMQEVFPTIHTIDVVGTTNAILVATKQPTSADALDAHLASLGPTADPLLTTSLQGAQLGRVPTIANDTFFTDNRAPVETLVDSLVIRYVLNSSGNLNSE